MTHNELPDLLAKLYSVVDALEHKYKRHFTPDGHMIGSLGEALAAHHYGLTLAPPSTKGFDATLANKQIEIKATQGTRIAMRSKPDFLLVLHLNKDGTFEEIYNGFGERVWAYFTGRKTPSNGQFQISLSRLRKMAKQVDADEIIPRLH